MDLTKTKKADEVEKFDLTQPIARSGEAQFAAIVRNRSGESAGEIDYGLRYDCVHPGEYQDLCDTAYALYRAVCEMTGKRARREIS